MSSSLLGRSRRVERFRTRRSFRRESSETSVSSPQPEISRDLRPLSLRSPEMFASFTQFERSRCCSALRPARSETSVSTSQPDRFNVSSRLRLESGETFESLVHFLRFRLFKPFSVPMDEMSVTWPPNDKLPAALRWLMSSEESAPSGGSSLIRLSNATPNSNPSIDLSPPTSPSFELNSQSSCSARAVLPVASTQSSPVRTSRPQATGQPDNFA